MFFMEDTQKKMKLSRKVITHPSFASFFICEIKNNIRHPLLLRQLKNNHNQTNTTGAHNFKELNNTAGRLSVFFVFFL
jgi:hypothetical protein